MLDLGKIRQTAERVAASHQLDVVDVECEGPGKRPVLRIFIEKGASERARLAVERLRTRETGQAGEAEALDHLAWITHEDCEIFSRDFGTILDVEDTAPDREYILEVSSPGLDRKLRNVEDFQRFNGSLIKIETVEPVEGNRHWLGRLTEVRKDRILVDPTSSGKRKKPRDKRRAAAKDEQKHPVLEVALANIAKANLVPEF